MSIATRVLLIFSFILVLALGGAYIVVFRPLNAQIAKGRKEIALKQDELAKLREATAQTADLAQKNEQIRQAIESIEARLPSAKEMDEVLRQVSNIAEKNSLKVPNFKRNDKAVPAGLALEQPLDIEITGDFDGFYQFLLELEQLPRITRVPDLSILRSDKVDGEMKAKMTLSVYYEGDAPPPPLPQPQPSPQPQPAEKSASADTSK